MYLFFLVMSTVYRKNGRQIRNHTQKSTTLNGWHKPSPNGGFIVGLNALCLLNKNDAASVSTSFYLFAKVLV